MLNSFLHVTKYPILVFSASKNKVTPLMLACQRGDLEMVKLLHLKGGAKLDGRDKLRRSPLMHAVIDGHAAVASYLLRAGVLIDHVDSSGNSALLYAVAYGWYDEACSFVF